MVRFTQRQLKDMVWYKQAWDVSDYTESDYWALMRKENILLSWDILAGNMAVMVNCTEGRLQEDCMQ